MGSIGQPLPHDSAREHVRGEAVYLDDLPPLHGELCIDVVGSPVAHGRIASIDLDAARDVTGIAGVFAAADVPGDHRFGPVVHDEDLLAKDAVEYVGQPVVVIAGETREAVAAAKALVKLEIEPLPAVLTIDEAIARQQFLGPTRRIARGDVTAALAVAEHRLSGELAKPGDQRRRLHERVVGNAGHRGVAAPPVHM